MRFASRALRLSGPAARRYSTATAAVKPSIALLARIRKENEGVPMTLAKRALVESNNDFDAAMAWLAEHAAQSGLAKQAKLTNRVARDGLVGIADLPLGSAIVEINSETDFVARSDIFRDLVHRSALTAHLLGRDDNAVPGTLAPLDIAALSTAPLLPRADATEAEPTTVDGMPVTIAGRVLECVGTLGENLTFRRATGVAIADTTAMVSGAYVHGDKAQRLEGVGRIGAVVVLKGTHEPLDARHSKLAQQLAQVIVGFNPPTVRELYTTPFAATTPFHTADGVEEVTVAKVLEGAQVYVQDFVRYEVGEGIEAQASVDFAEEVKRQVAASA
ncbi:elongation factor TS-domain-containing protein [Blastocladiella britannica]|nr:elongation factor TS-domain-containing protein [Blastocladiella britannica]